MINSMRIGILLPTYNECDNIQDIVNAIFLHVPEAHVVVVDDNSPDGTHELVRSMQSTYPTLELLLREKKEGLGKAYIDGFKYFTKKGSVDAVLMMDADFSHDPASIPGLAETAKNYDVVVGSRYVAGGGTEGWETWRLLLSKFGNFYARSVVKMPVRDCTGGFNLIRTEFLKKIDFELMDMSGYAFQIELKYLLAKAGARFTEVPILFKNRVNGESKITNHIIREGIIAPWKIRKK